VEVGAQKPRGQEEDSV
jgi:hypothetical protein